MVFKVGLTGGIGSGKTLACEIFSSFGVPLIDADKVTSELTAPRMPKLEEIRDAFGSDILDDEGNLRRSRLRKIIFSDANERRKLEKILHSTVREKIQNFIASVEAPYCIVSSPLLIESNMVDLVDIIAVIDCSESLQIERTKKREGIEETEILRIIAAQIPRLERLAAAAVIIDNSTSKVALEKHLKLLHKNFYAKGQALRA